MKHPTSSQAQGAAPSLIPTAEPIALKRAVLYLRVSSKRQVETDFDPEGYSLPSQRDICYRKAQDLGAEVVEEYVDKGESAKTADRPRLQDMIARVTQRRDIDFCIVFNVSRLARNREDDVILTMTLRRAGAQLVSATENIDETPIGTLIHAIMAGVAEFNNARQADDVLRGMMRKAETGGTPHMAPTGYLHVRQFVDGREVRTIALDPERAHHVLWGFEQYATGEYGVRQLTDMLATRGLTTRPSLKQPAKPLCRSKVAGMLHNRYYTGTLTYRGVQYEGRHEAIVPVELFERVQEVLRAHDRVASRQRVHNHYLKGHMVCHQDGERMILSRSRGKSGQHYLYFACARRHREGGCSQPYALAEVLEQDVVHWYLERAPRLTPDMAAELRKELHDEIAAEQKRHEKVVGRERARLNRLKAERLDLLQAYYAKRIPPDLLGEEQERINREMLDAQRQLDAAESRYADAEVAIGRALDLMACCGDMYREGSRQLRRKLNHVLYKRFDVSGREVDDAEPTEHMAALMGFIDRRRPGWRDAAKGGRARARLTVLSSGRCSTREELVEPRGFEPRTSAVRRQRSPN